MELPVCVIGGSVELEKPEYISLGGRGGGGGFSWYSLTARGGVCILLRLTGGGVAMLAVLRFLF